MVQRDALGRVVFVRLADPQLVGPSRPLVGGLALPDAQRTVRRVKPRATVMPDTGAVQRSKIVRTGSSCGCPKMAYTSKKVAKAVAHQQSKASGERIEAYHCYGGHCYHIGHPPGSRAA